MKELQTILYKAHHYHLHSIDCVLASIVKIEGSGYRRQGTRMLISENGEFTGAISGGCVEKEVWFQSKRVLDTGESKIITYDGRYRLGCEGTLYILIERININESILEEFNKIYDAREPLVIQSYFGRTDSDNRQFGTYLLLREKLLSLKGYIIDKTLPELNHLESLKQELKPAKSLLIFGSEHDSVALCKIASLVGWDVTIIAHPLNEKEQSYFPGASDLVHLLPEEISVLKFDNRTACILMSHSFSRDLAYLLELSKLTLPYIGLLGPQKRKNQLLHQLLELNTKTNEDIIETIYGPVGLDIGAETAEEIAISVLGELQSVFTNTPVDHLRNKFGSIHERT